MSTPQGIRFLGLCLDLLALALVLGATVWFFFIQSPVLLRTMGREKFVPVQMRLTVVFFNTVSVALLLALLGVLVAGMSWSSREMVTVVGALAAAVVNKYIVVPRALRAGGRSRKEISGRDAEGSTTGFASEGAGTATRRMHRLVVVFVLLMVAGVVVHVLTLLRGV